MINYLKIEFLKVRSYKTVWILVGLFIIGFVLGASFLESMLNKSVSPNPSSSLFSPPQFTLYAFPAIWHNLFFIAGFIKIFPGFLLIMLVTNEFTHKTLKQSVINGMSKIQIVNSKVIMALSTAFFTTLLIFLTIFANGIIHNKGALSWELITEKMFFAPAYFLELTTYLMVCLLFAMVIKKPIVAILSMLLYSLIAEPIIAFKVGEPFNRFFPLKAAINLIQIPKNSLMQIFGHEFQEFVKGEDILICIAYCLLIYVALLVITVKSDL
ncbi:MAG: hypothetical protein CSA95_08985 [Bacteroidetes bacterium]|nr:MAG: hypothetical protein CSA95_08985 [Bacteroidota bacterium]PIE88136.1 MAG: hypothetical protein CSA04_03500 [Bacteroidota bacterium]